MERWQLKSTSARYYERFMVPVLFQPWAERLVKAARLQRGSRVLDLACGTGVVARFAAHAVGARGAVVGVDLNKPMLAMARSIPAGPGAPIRWRAADAANLPFHEGTFDAVLCQQGFQFFPDPVQAAREAARVLKPKGRFALNVWCGPDQNPWGAALIQMLDKHAGESAARGMRQPFSLADRAAVADIVAAAGFKIVSITTIRQNLRSPVADSFFHGLMKALPFAAEIGTDTQEAVVRDCLSALNGHVRRPNRLLVPSATHTIVAVKQRSA